ncbi:MAG: hypothetical protein MUF49_25250 [Oculatellaceae cyanobacterium Prado106]|nr:hypothetical protein [Oculatellaceae cyanobacterium Prado106]
MTQTPHDRFAKQVLEGFLEPFGQVVLNRPIVGEPRAADVWFVPHPQPEGIEALGVLGRMAHKPCLIEPFRNPIQRRDILSCVGKLADLHAELTRKAKRNKIPLKTLKLPRLWILTPTASKGLLQEFPPKAKDITTWGTGFYFSPPTFDTGIVVINQLPRVPETLWLRLMGRGQVQSDAIAELISLPRDHPFRLHALERLSVLRFNLELRQNLRKGEQELAMNLSPAYLEWREAMLREARQEAHQAGRQEEIRGMLEAKFGSLDDSLEQLLDPLMTLSAVERSRLILQSSREELLAWLARQS